MKKRICIAVVILLIAGLAGLATYNLRSDNKAKSGSSVSSQQTKKAAITYSQDGKTVDYKGESGKTALVTLKSLTNVVTKTSSIGEYVTSINGLTADSNTQYWAFYVNDKMADKGAGSYQATSNDNIEWRLEQL